MLGSCKSAGHCDQQGLWSMMELLPELKNHVRKGDYCGVDIEGLAVSKGRLYFGFRSPAAILSVDTEAFFKGEEPKANVTLIELGAGRGIRDMVAVENGFLLLTGPDDDQKNKSTVNWKIDWWDGKSVTPKTLAQLDLSGLTTPRTLQKGKSRKCKDNDERKPEVITVLDETPKAYKLLILSDRNVRWRSNDLHRESLNFAKFFSFTRVNSSGQVRTAV